jgi:hypothetical protein
MSIQSITKESGQTDGPKLPDRSFSTVIIKQSWSRSLSLPKKMSRTLLPSSTSLLSRKHTTLRLFFHPSLSRASSSSPASTSLHHESPLLRYDSLVQSGALNYDAHQRTILMKLDALHDKLEDYRAPKVPESLPGGETAGFVSGYHISPGICGDFGLPSTSAWYRY